MLITLILVLSFLGLNAFIFRDLLHPAIIFSFLWFFQLLGVNILSSIYSPLSLNLLMIVTVGIICFSFGCYFSSVLPVKKILHERELRGNQFFLWFVFMLCLVGLVAQFSIVYGQPGDTFARKMIGLRVKELNEDIFGIWKYFSTLSIAFLLLLSIRTKKMNPPKLGSFLYPFMIIICLASAFLSTGRTPIITTIIILLIVKITSRTGRTSPLDVAGYAIPGLVITYAVFWAVGALFGKVGSSNLDAYHNFVTYIFSALPALDIYIHSADYLHTQAKLGEHTFRFANALGYKLGFGNAPDPLVQEFVQVPHFTNLYTVYHVYLKDFKYAGVVIFPFILGFFHTALYAQFKKHRQNDLIYFLFVLSCIPLIQVIFQETYFSLFSTWLQFLVLGIILTSRKINRVGKR
jgi:oligosaccharide repeat unit polymerase